MRRWSLAPRLLWRLSALGTCGSGPGLLELPGCFLPRGSLWGRPLLCRPPLGRSLLCQTLLGLLDGLPDPSGLLAASRPAAPGLKLTGLSLPRLSLLGVSLPGLNLPGLNLLGLLGSGLLWLALLGPGLSCLGLAWLSLLCGPRLSLLCVSRLFPLLPPSLALLWGSLLGLSASRLALLGLFLPGSSLSGGLLPFGPSLVATLAPAVAPLLVRVAALLLADALVLPAALLAALPVVRPGSLPVRSLTSLAPVRLVRREELPSPRVAWLLLGLLALLLAELLGVAVVGRSLVGAAPVSVVLVRVVGTHENPPAVRCAGTADLRASDNKCG